MQCRQGLIFLQVGAVSELLLAVLNTNVHVYQVSPVLTLIEKYTARTLARLFGLSGEDAGGISQPGGSASNQTSIVIARNTLFPETKTDGYGAQRFVLFTSEHGHYSLEKAAQMFGFGSKAVWSVPVDGFGQLIPSKLEELIAEARSRGFTPFYVNATAGTTVLGSFDPFEAIADICKREKLWMHVDGAWGGSVVFSETLRKGRLNGIERADSIAINPHKMLGVPMPCSFLLGKDLREFHRANTLPAG
jgi:glutamate decarboxylase